jgi:hypothetical protein
MWDVVVQLQIGSGQRQAMPVNMLKDASERHETLSLQRGNRYSAAGLKFNAATRVLLSPERTWWWLRMRWSSVRRGDEGPTGAHQPRSN